MSVDILTITKNYLKALKQGKTGKDLAIFFQEDAAQTEMPNRMNPKGGTNNLAVLLERAEQSKKVLKSQDFEVKNMYVNGNTVIAEVVWKAALHIHVGSLAAGQTMTAHSAMFIEFKDDKIISQRNYDCFEAF